MKVHVSLPAVNRVCVKRNGVFWWILKIHPKLWRVDFSENISDLERHHKCLGRINIRLLS